MNEPRHQRGWRTAPSRQTTGEEHGETAWYPECTCHGSCYVHSPLMVHVEDQPLSSFERCLLYSLIHRSNHSFIHSCGNSNWPCTAEERVTRLIISILFILKYLIDSFTYISFLVEPVLADLSSSMLPSHLPSRLVPVSSPLPGQ